MVIESQISGQITERVVSQFSSPNLAMSEIRRLADGLDMAVERGAMTADQANAIRTELTDVRTRLGDAGIALGSNVTPDVLRIAQHYRVSSIRDRQSDAHRVWCCWSASPVPALPYFRRVRVSVPATPSSAPALPFWPARPRSPF